MKGSPVSLSAQESQFLGLDELVVSSIETVSLPIQSLKMGRYRFIPIRPRSAAKYFTCIICT